MVYPLVSIQRPIIVNIQSRKKAEKATEITEQYDWKFILEDLAILKKR
jgi:hypothetical protein